MDITKLEVGRTYHFTLANGRECYGEFAGMGQFFPRKGKPLPVVKFSRSGSERSLIVSDIESFDEDLGGCDGCETGNAK